MGGNILLILADAAEAEAARTALMPCVGAGGEVEWARRCDQAVDRLCRESGVRIAAIVTELALPDSHALETFDRLACASAGIPILVLTRRCDQRHAQLALQGGAQDYLLKEGLDGQRLSQSVTRMSQRMGYAAALYQDRKGAQRTLDTLTDAVISTDAAGKLLYLNPAAERLTGWRAYDAVGLTLAHVLRIIDADSREAAAIPLAMTTKALGLGPHCVLIRRDGSETAVEDGIAPIRDWRGWMTGTVIVLHGSL